MFNYRRVWPLNVQLANPKTGYTELLNSLGVVEKSIPVRIYVGANPCCFFSCSMTILTIRFFPLSWADTQLDSIYQAVSKPVALVAHHPLKMVQV